jgi:hypothetical protein
MTQMKYYIIHSSQNNVFKSVNTKRKLLYCNANIDFNKECLTKKITPNYAKINLKPVNDAAKTTIQKAERIRIKRRN